MPVVFVNLTAAYDSFFDFNCKLLRFLLDKYMVTIVWHYTKFPAAEVTCGLRAGAGAKTSDTAFLFFVYSTAEYWSLICSRSTWFYIVS